MVCVEAAELLWDILGISEGFSSVELGEILCEEQQAELRWSSLAPSGTELFTELFSPHLHHSLGLLLCLCFISLSYRTTNSLSVY